MYRNGIYRYHICTILCRYGTRTGSTSKRYFVRQCQCEYHEQSEFHVCQLAQRALALWQNVKMVVAHCVFAFCFLTFFPLVNFAAVHTVNKQPIKVLEMQGFFHPLSTSHCENNFHQLLHRHSLFVTHKVSNDRLQWEWHLDINCQMHTWNSLLSSQWQNYLSRRTILWNGWN